MAAKWPIFDSRHFEIWKTTFPTEFVNEIWLRIGDHKYINIVAIKKILPVWFQGQHIFSAPQKC